MEPRMNKFTVSILVVIVCGVLAACGKEASNSAAAEQAAQTMPTEAVSADTPAPATDIATAPPSESETPEAASSTPADTANETDGGETDGQETVEQTAATVQPSLRLGGPAATSPTSSQFREGANYQKLVPAQPTGVKPGKVEVAEVFWYGCGHCFTLDPAIESWRGKSKAGYVEFVRLPAMWNDITRMHARLFFTAELLGKLDALHPLIFREIHVNGNQLNTLDKISAFFKQHGVSAEEFTKAFSSFAVESKLQRADFLNRRYRVESVPMVVVNGKYTTDLTDAGGERPLFSLIDELAAHENGG